MPNPPQVQPSVQPSPSFLQRMFGSSQMTPEMQQGVDIARKENPSMAPVQPYGFFSRLLQPKAQGYVSPGGGSIYLNPDQMQGLSPQDVADTLTHEQTHVNQARQSGYGPTMSLLQQLLPDRTPYGQRPTEMEAFQNEKNRRYAMGRPQTPIASFTGGDYIPQEDINLPNPSIGASPRVLQNRGPVTMR